MWIGTQHAQDMFIHFYRFIFACYFSFKFRFFSIYIIIMHGDVILSERIEMRHFWAQMYCIDFVSDAKFVCAFFSLLLCYICLEAISISNVYEFKV